MYLRPYLVKLYHVFHIVSLSLGKLFW